MKYLLLLLLVLVSSSCVHTTLPFPNTCRDTTTIFIDSVINIHNIANSNEIGHNKYYIDSSYTIINVNIDNYIIRGHLFNKKLTKKKQHHTSTRITFTQIPPEYNSIEIDSSYRLLLNNYFTDSTSYLILDSTFSQPDSIITKQIKNKKIKNNEKKDYFLYRDCPYNSSYGITSKFFNKTARKGIQV